MTTEERLARHLGQSPRVPASAYVAPGATLLGDVVLGEEANIWPGCVIRADINSVRIGDRSNIQDGTVIHLSDDYGVVIGDDVTVGHCAILHACTIGNECLVGMGAVVMDGAVIGEQSIIGARALVTPGTVVPPGSVVVGSPARVSRTLGDEERANIRRWAAKYLVVARAHRDGVS
ncbi:gamma carbonic anhydrase family protein [Marinihelvus fidelis]|uniref:Gamma carbonic anhydrase family protein n=1 Tax=Marinihelvus fidelis TaxID=2613842 RepID=A0A5N0TEF9_9GAMM|nr:gamma carbonic anhydrase family protein [Marinihelvus fidelis]